MEEQKFRIADLISKCEERDRIEKYLENSDCESFYDAKSQIEEEEEEEKRPAKKAAYFRILVSKSISSRL